MVLTYLHFRILFYSHRLNGGNNKPSPSHHHFYSWYKPFPNRWILVFLLAMFMIISPTKNLEYNSRHFVLWYCDLLGYDLFIFLFIFSTPFEQLLTPIPSGASGAWSDTAAGAMAASITYDWCVARLYILHYVYIYIHITHYYCYCYYYYCYNNNNYY
jgi:hypothetical protein